MSKDFILNSSRNNIIRISAFGEQNLKNAPCVIFVHGFKGFKNWGIFPYSAEYFAERGFFVLTFNFSHNGVGPNLFEFDELDKFSKNTFSLEIEEIEELIQNYQKGFFGSTQNSDIFLIGHSRGGAISLLTASRLSAVKGLAVWASVAKLDRYSERQKEKWIEKGVFEVLNTRTNQVMSLNVSLLEDIEKNKHDLLNIEKSVKNLKKPLLILHGSEDLAVPVKEPEQLFEWSDKDITELKIIKATGHTFNAVHPFEGSNQKFEEVLKLTNEFFNKYLNRG